MTTTNRFIAIAGNIGVGKSTLTRLLAERLGWKPFYEAVDDNPYLSDFYQDKAAWGFHSQVYFLTRRLQHHRRLMSFTRPIIQDRTIYEDAEIFARNLYQQGLMNERDYRSYRELYETMGSFLQPPDLIIYLQADIATLLKRIRMRGRDYEQGIEVAYLGQLNRLYEDWIDAYQLSPVLIVPAEHLDFVAHSSHLDLIVKKVEDLLDGKLHVTFLPEELSRVTRAA
ncbi:MAG: deoxynucleoside kinase [Chloroflexi bacterium]|nr:deoxynucleoside kinase [Chloroflexota bacterium]